MAKPLSERVKTDPGLLRRVLKNPGLRSKLSDAQLRKADPKLYAQRKTNIRLRQPIVTGSSTTEGDLAREAQAAMAVKFGPLEREQQQTVGEEQARARDVGGPGGFYDQYLKQVAQHAQNVQNIGAQAAQTGLGTQQGITGLANTDLTQLNQRATADAAARGATSGDIAQMASNAAAIRQGLVGSFIAQQAGQNAASSNYADTLANVVAPGQKLGAQAMAAGQVRKAQDKVTGTIADKAAEDYVYRAGRRTDEAKNILAQQIATGKSATDLARLALEAKRVTETKRSNLADEGTAQARINAASQATADKAAAKGREPNKYGIPAGQWATWSTSHRRRVIDAFDKTGGAKGKPGKAPDWAPSGQTGKAMTQLTTLKDYIGRAKRGDPFVAGHARQKPMTREQAKEKVRQNSPSLMHPALLDAATDAVFGNGVLSSATVTALKQAGYKPSEVARTLGAKTAGDINYNARIRRGEVAGPPAPRTTRR